MKSAKTDGGWLPLHGSLTPAHTCGCAAQCFEGVQRGSIIIRQEGLGNAQPRAHYGKVLFAPSISDILADLPFSSLQTDFVSVCRIKRIARCQSTICKAMYQPGKALLVFKGPFLADAQISHNKSVESGVRSLTGVLL